jgi:tRNA (guanine37-N1)-methyltransferase
VEQEKLEERVRHIFERQGFNVEIKGNRFKAQGEQTEVSGTLFSSQRFEKEEVVEAAEGKVFVDEALSSVADTLDDVSVLESQDTGDIDMPSFEVIGDIVVINQLEMPEAEAVDAILSHHNVKTILLKTEPLRGEFRVGEYRKLYGTETETIHRENGCRFKVDVTEAYFSERFSAERRRATSEVEEGEKVLVPFAGVGPFPILAADQGAKRVLAVEKNPSACDYLRYNAQLNDCADRVKVKQGDVSDLLPVEADFDRVFMPSPTNSADFLEECAVPCREEAKMYVYVFARDSGEAQRKVSTDFLTVSRAEKCGERSPSESRYRVEAYASSVP